MELKSQTNTFNGGMDLDTDVTQLPASKYREAENIRILANDGATAGALQNIEDVREYGTIFDTDEIILGTAVTNWYCKDTDKVEQVGVAVTKENYNNVLLNNIYVVRNFDNQVLDVRLILSLKQVWTEHVSLVTNYEKESVCHLYISNGEQEIKTLNLQKDYGTTKDEPLEDAAEITILPKGVILQPQLDGIIEGTLTGGTYVYVCQLYELNGGQSIFSAASELIRLTSAQETEGSSFKGDSTLVTTNKGVRISCEFYSGQCDRLRFIRCYYKTSVDQPSCEVIAEINVETSDEQQIYTLEDAGIAALSTITTSDLNELINNFTAETIIKYKNRMFAANIKQFLFDVENYDTRAYRCNSQGVVKLVDPVNTIECDIQDILSGKVVVPKECYCLNPLNTALAYAEENSDDEYAFTSDKKIRGGSGLNISYEFFTTTFCEDDKMPLIYNNRVYLGRDARLDPNAYSISTLDLVGPERGATIKTLTVDATTRQWNARSSYVCNRFTGYQRDGIYRFGVVFTNKNGQNSPVHWIGDIRFPARSITNYDAFLFADTFGNKNVSLTSKPLGIKFTVNNLPEEVHSYRIVRVHRTNADRNVVTQGVLSKTLKFNGWNDAQPESYLSNDYRPPILPSFFRLFTNNAYIYVWNNKRDSNMYPLLAGRFKDDYSEIITDDSNANNINHMDATGVFFFTSPDLCFNQQNIGELVTKNMFINPLTLVDGATVFNWKNLYRTCIGTNLPQVGFENNPADDPKYSTFAAGLMLDLKTNVSTVIAAKGGFFAGGAIGDVGKGSSGTVIKYYRFVPKHYAQINGKAGESHFCKITAATTASILDKNFVRNEGDFDARLKLMKACGLVVNGDVTFINTPVGAESCVGIGSPGVCIISKELQRLYPGVTESLGMWDSAAFCPMIVNICKNTVPFGGYTYNALCNSIYSVTVASAKNTENELYCFGGDTYLNVCDIVHCYRYNVPDPTTYYSTRPFVGYYIPVETAVNNYYRNDDHFSETITYSGDPLSYAGNTANIFYGLKLGDASDTGYIMTTDAYKLNSSYNLLPELFKYAALQKDTDLVSVRRTTITASELKTNGETNDKFRTFKFANYLETDLDKGQITNLKVFQDKLYFFQDEGVGIASVNERSLIQDSNSNAINIGTGDVLSRYDYLVTRNGDSIINDKSIVSTDAALYWYDYEKNTICVISNGFRELSKEKNVQSYLLNLKDKDRTLPVSLYDKKYNEVWFKLCDKSLIFNERTNCFTSFYTHNPNWAFELTDKIVTIKVDNSCYLLNTYVKDETERDENVSKIRFLINQEPLVTKTYDNQWFSAELIDSKNKKPQIIKDVYFETKTQTTEPIDYTTIENREDTYRFAIGREKLTFPELYLQTSKSFASRMKGKYMICNYTFDCNNNREFKLPYMTTIYRHSLL